MLPMSALSKVEAHSHTQPTAPAHCPLVVCTLQYAPRLRYGPFAVHAHDVCDEGT